MVDSRYLVEEQLKVWIAGEEALRGRTDIFGGNEWIPPGRSELRPETWGSPGCVRGCSFSPYHVLEWAQK